MLTILQTKQKSLEDIGVLFGDPPHIAHIGTGTEVVNMKHEKMDAES